MGQMVERVHTLGRAVGVQDMPEVARVVVGKQGEIPAAADQVVADTYSYLSTSRNQEPAPPKVIMLARCGYQRVY